MASKRGDKPVQKRNRRPLAQGRLVNNNATKLQQSDSDGFHSLEQERLVSSPRAKLQSRVTKPTDRDEPRLTPRRDTPKRSEKLAVMSERSHSLDLSDSDIDHSDKAPVHHLKCNLDQPSILVVDAPHQSFDINCSDIDTVTGYAMSPGKVVCHSPRVRPGSAARSRRVPIDKVPHIVVAESGHRDLDHHGLPALATSVGDRQDVGAATLKSAPPVLGISPTNRPVPTLPASPQGYPQPDFDDSLKLRSLPDEVNTRFGGDHSDDQISMSSMGSDTSSLREVLGNSTRNSHSAKRRGTGQKKKVRVVASRYLQTAGTIKPTTGSKQNSCKKSASQSASVLHSSKGSHSFAKSARKKNPSVKKNESLSSTIQQTPAPSQQQQHSVSGKTSTPTHDEVSFLHNIDASAIAADNTSAMATTDFPGDLSFRPPLKKKVIPKKQSKVTQLDLDLEYARYLQWLYLGTAARKTLQDQERCAMGQLNSLWEEVENLREKETGLKSELEQLEHANLLDEQLDLQISGLSPVTEKLPELTSEHKLLAQALDTTRHQISASGVHLPVDQDNYQESLISALNESEKVLGELTVMMRQQTPKVTEFACGLESLYKAVDREGDLHKECEDLLSAAQSKTTAELSLMIQAILATEIASVGEKLG